jgi:hypothetical protein
MVMSIQEIKDELRKLNKAQQAELMHFMIELPASDEFELSEKWKAELNRREKALDKGTSVGRPARDIIAKYTSC